MEKHAGVRTRNATKKRNAKLEAERTGKKQQHKKKVKAAKKVGVENVSPKAVKHVKKYTKKSPRKVTKKPKRRQKVENDPPTVAVDLHPKRTAVVSRASANSSTLDISKAPSSLSKKPFRMPNFAAIHERHYNGMEGIDAYSQRKKERAELLLSGNKPTIGIVAKSGDIKSRKRLNFKPIEENCGAGDHAPSIQMLTKSEPTPKVKSRQAIEKQKVELTSKMKMIQPAIQRQEYRMYIQGVRSNKRFDLLMKFRDR